MNRSRFAALPWRPPLAPGLALCLALALAAIELGKLSWLAAHGLSALTLAIVLGLLMGNSVYGGDVARHSAEGVRVARQWLLRAGIVLYGLRLTLQDIGQVGLAGMVIDALVLCSTLGLAWLVGTRLLQLDGTTAMLVGAGSAICGAAAVMATQPVLQARAEKVSVAVSTVVVFGTLAMFVYPALYALNLGWGFVPAGQEAFGLYAGSTVHEVAQVVAAARAVGEQAADTAVIAKMVRVMMLAPFLVALSAWQARAARREAGARQAAGEHSLALPWFAFLFLGVVIIHSLIPLPQGVVRMLNELDTLLLAMAMGALGLGTQLSALRQAGLRPLLLGALLFAWLVAGGAAINTGVTRLVH